MRGCLDGLIRGALLVDGSGPFDLGLSGGRIAAIEPHIDSDVPAFDAAGGLVCCGLTESHIHLDKAGILGRCRVCAGTLAEAISETARVKPGFTSEDVYARARRVVEHAIAHGTNRLRSFVEIDPRAGYRSFEAIRQIRRDYAWAIDIEICAFAQDGLSNDPGTEQMLARALKEGANLVGGCPYTDTDPPDHVRRIFDLAQRHDVPLDLHLDFDLEPAGSLLPAVIAQTRRRGWGGRVSVGHVTKLSALPRSDFLATGRQLAEAGIGVTVLPATDLYLTGRNVDRLVPRGLTPAHRLAELGVVTSIATNNVLNPFTPFGDASLVRMANLYATVAQVGTAAGLEQVFRMISSDATRLLGGAPGRIAVGEPADLVVFAAGSTSAVIAENAPARAGWKRGRASFVRPAARLLAPAGSGAGREPGPDGSDGPDT
ncbi:MAG TPA: amidohydrolase family protein [Steroidobacteraceae bacterium]